jgi:hypothetical protein
VVCKIGSTEITSPHTFLAGTTTVNCTATNTAGTDSCSFTVTVNDTEKPTISCPADLTDVHTDLGACSASGVALGTPTTGDNCGVFSVTNDAPASFPKGTTTVTWTVTDTSGNTATCTQQVTVKDHENPTITCPTTGTSGIATCVPGSPGAVVNYPASTATDNCPGLSSVVCTQPSGSTFLPGTTQVTASATDASGNPGSCTFYVTVAYTWSGILQPINADGSSLFKLGSTVPVKFQLLGDSACVPNGVFKLYVAKVSNDVVGTEAEAVSSTPANTDSLFRYDPTGGLYIYNLGTKGTQWSAGTWQLRIDLGDGVSHTVLISLKK